MLTLIKKPKENGESRTVGEGLKKNRRWLWRADANDNKKAEGLDMRKRIKIRSANRIMPQIAVMMLFATAMLARCANPMAPQGGPIDSLPPRPVEMTPKMGQTNFDQKRIYIEFDEYIKLKDQQKEFYTSPAMKKKPMLSMKGKGVRIDIQDTLKENTTYSLNFGSSIEDNNEGNPLKGFRYVFSTGEAIDSMIMSGYTTDAYKKDSVSKTFIYFFSAEKDSIPEYDSTLFLHLPDAIARAENNGIFIAENLKPIDYRVYAVKDENNNQQYEPGVDKVGFLEGTYNPVEQEQFEVWYDTIRQHLVADPQIYFRMFKDVQFKRQYLVESSRPMSQKVMFHYGAEYPVIDTINFEGIDKSKIIIEQLKPTGDSTVYWFNVPQEQMPDTLRGFVTYMKHDSINNMVAEVKDFAMVWRESKQVEKEREERKKEREKALEKGEEPKPEPNPFSVKVSVKGELNPEKSIEMEFGAPLVEVDSAAISIIRVEGENMYRVRNRFVQDSINIRTWRLMANWQQGQKYQLEIPEGAFINVIGERNDTLKATFTVMDPEKYGTLVFNVKGKTEQSQYVLQIISGSAGTVQEEIKEAKSGKYHFRYLQAGEVRLRVVEDLNGNGVWDVGNMVERREPERVEIFTTENGEQTITTKANWELEFEVDMNTLFKPMTMEMLKERLRKEEQERMRKYIEELEKNPPKQNRNQNQNQNRGSQGMGGMGGMGGIGGMGGGGRQTPTPVRR